MTDSDTPFEKLRGPIIISLNLVVLKTQFQAGNFLIDIKLNFEFFTVRFSHGSPQIWCVCRVLHLVDTNDWLYMSYSMNWSLFCSVLFSFHLVYLVLSKYQFSQAHCPGISYVVCQPEIEMATDRTRIFQCDRYFCIMVLQRVLSVCQVIKQHQSDHIMYF